MLADVRPGGAFLMEDFFYAGGLRALLPRLATVPARATPGDRHRPHARRAARERGRLQRGGHPRPDHALSAEGGVAVMRGSLAPDGAVIKHVAADPGLLDTGAAVVFDSYQRHAAAHRRPLARALARLGTGARERRAARRPRHAGWDAADPQVTAPRRGPRHGPGLRRAVGRDQLRAACRTSRQFGAGGALALVRAGDLIELDVAARSLRLEVPDAELAKRRNGAA